MSNWNHEYERSHCPENSWNYTNVFFDGVPCERFELRTGDYDPTTSELSIKRERAEKCEVGDLQGKGSKLWYAWSFHVPETYEDCVFVEGSSGDVTLAQFHQRFEESPWDPPWMFGKAAGRAFRVRRFPTYIARKRNQPLPEWPLISDSEFRGRWHEIVVNAHWSAGEDGLFEVWVNGVKKMSYTGTTCFQRGSEIYHKYGLYRASHYQNPDAVVCYKDLKRGSSQVDVTSSSLSL